MDPSQVKALAVELHGILGGIRLTRGALEAHAAERLRDTRNKLSDVTATTESATLELMDGLDRSLELINTLEAQSNHAASATGFQQLRDQVSALYNHLQFQDITTQQIQGVGQTLLDLEARVAGLASLFDHALGAGLTASLMQLGEGPSAQLPYNPEATMHRSRADQAMIDKAFAGARNGPPRP